MRPRLNDYIHKIVKHQWFSYAQDMKILGIETSCDDTGIAIIEVKGTEKPVFKVLANIVSSQIKLHRQYGGIYPSLAKREHEKNLPLILKKLPWQNIDAIALTVGPGLDPCLWAGITFAKKLSQQLRIPIIPVNHTEGHLLISLLGNDKSKFQMPNAKTTFPAIALIVSGGHTQLVLVKKLKQYKIIGETRDDAAGECLDKTARMLGLAYPGGPAVAAQAALAGKSTLSIKLPKPMMHTKDYDFSFSGLKTAVLYDYKSHSQKVQKSKTYITAMAKEIQQTVIDILIAKTMRAAREYQAKSVILGGGVAANKELRKQLKSNIQSTTSKIKVFVAPPKLCTDNGLMIALAGYIHRNNKTKNIEQIGSQPNLRIE